ncbi:uncharacterized protein [Dermacentor albipictus]|uniref:uncharacterized protein n=1 Tax=Dermacentor albipictus TaxID=60249 RepID=UPI0031FCE95D
MFVGQQGATSLIWPLEKGGIPADTVCHDTAAMHPYSRRTLVQVLLLLFLDNLPSRPRCLDGPMMNVWMNDTSAFITEPSADCCPPLGCLHHIASPTLEATTMFVGQQGATSLIWPLEKGGIPADTVCHDTAAMHPYSRRTLVQERLIAPPQELRHTPWPLLVAHIKHINRPRQMDSPSTSRPWTKIEPKSDGLFLFSSIPPSLPYTWESSTAAPEGLRRTLWPLLAAHIKHINRSRQTDSPSTSRPWTQMYPKSDGLFIPSSIPTNSTTQTETPTNSTTESKALAQAKSSQKAQKCVNIRAR